MTLLFRVGTSTNNAAKQPTEVQPAMKHQGAKTALNSGYRAAFLASLAFINNVNITQTLTNLAAMSFGW